MSHHPKKFIVKDLYPIGRNVGVTPGYHYQAIRSLNHSLFEVPAFEGLSKCTVKLENIFNTLYGKTNNSKSPYFVQLKN